MAQNNDIEIGKIKGFIFYRKVLDNAVYIKKGNTILNINFNEINTLTYLLPLLEEKDISLLYKEHLPVSSIIEAALLSNSEYWINESLKHISDIGVYRHYLKDIVDNKRYSQTLRHKIQKMIKNRTIK